MAIWLALLVLAGCASQRSPAPVRERVPGSNGALPARAEAVVPPGHYRVLAGDTLYKIAFEQGQDFREIALWNGLVDPTRIRAGDVIRVVPPKPTARPPAKTEQAPPTVSGNGEEAPPERWVWPLRGPLLARFGDGLNKGIDIAGPRGTLVQAAASGRVVYAGSGLRGYGKLIIIRHGKTLLSAYAHNARILVTEGQNVVRGQAVGEIGDSDADRVKLHFEIREFGRPVDPMIYLPNTG